MNLKETKAGKHPETNWRISGKSFSPKPGISMPNWIGFPNHATLNPRKINLKTLKPGNIQKQWKMIFLGGNHFHQNLEFLCQTALGFQTLLPPTKINLKKKARKHPETFFLWEIIFTQTWNFYAKLDWVSKPRCPEPKKNIPLNWRIFGKPFSPKPGISMPIWNRFSNQAALNPKKLTLKN